MERSLLNYCPSLLPLKGSHKMNNCKDPYRIFHIPRPRRWDSRDRYRNSSAEVCKRKSYRIENCRSRTVHLDLKKENDNNINKRNNRMK